MRNWMTRSSPSQIEHRKCTNAPGCMHQYLDISRAAYRHLSEGVPLGICRSALGTLFWYKSALHSQVWHFDNPRRFVEASSSEWLNFISQTMMLYLNSSRAHLNVLNPICVIQRR